MTKAMTGSFYLTETVTLPLGGPSGGRYQGTIDLGAYVSVAQGIAVAVEQADFIWQVGGDLGYDASTFLASSGALGAQLSDLNPGTAFVRADDQSLIASGAINIDQPNNIATHTADLYPDSFGPANLSEAFLIVNDSCYLVAGNDAALIGVADVYCTVRLKCRIVRLSKSDWIAIAIQSTASDN